MFSFLPFSHGPSPFPLHMSPIPWLRDIGKDRMAAVPEHSGLYIKTLLSPYCFTPVANELRKNPKNDSKEFPWP